MAKPEKVFKAGRCQASVFENKIAKEGNEFSVFNVSFQKWFKDPEGKIKTTNTLNLNEVPKAIVVLTQAYQYLVSRKNDNNNGDMEIEPTNDDII
jgi:hypothetical protein